MKTLHIVIIIFVLSATFVFSLLIQNLVFADSSISRISQTAVSGSNVFVTWHEISNGNTTILFRKSSDYGNTFVKTVEIARDVGGVIDSKMAVSGNNVYVAWYADSGKNSQVFLKKSSDYGNSFGSASVLSDQNSLCNSVNGLVATGSNVYIFFNCYDVSAQQGSIVFRASNDNATSFGKPIVLFKGKGIYSNGFL